MWKSRFRPKVFTLGRDRIKTPRKCGLHVGVTPTCRLGVRGQSFGGGYPSTFPAPVCDGFFLESQGESVCRCSSFDGLGPVGHSLRGAILDVKGAGGEVEFTSGLGEETANDLHYGWFVELVRVVWH